MADLSNNSNIPEPLTKDNYKRHRNALKSYIACSILFGLLFSVFPFTIMYAAVSSYN